MATVSPLLSAAGKTGHSNSQDSWAKGDRRVRTSGQKLGKRVMRKANLYRNVHFQRGRKYA
jgi:hypothetical protein